MSGLLPFLGSALQAAAPGLFVAGGQAALGGVANRKQFNRSKKLAAYQNDLNKQYLDYYNVYNTPAMQMERFGEAGLNPHLVYSQGNPGNQASPQQAADFPNLPDFGYLQQIMPLISQTMLQQSQVQATNAKTESTYAITALKRLEKQVMEKNPLLNDAGYKAMIDSIIAQAQIKSSEAGIKGVESAFFTDRHWYEKNGEMVYSSRGFRKLEAEFELIEQKYNLGQLDSKLKAEVLKSKQFQNDILAIQQKFMTEFELSPDIWIKFAQLILMKSF